MTNNSKRETSKLTPTDHRIRVSITKPTIHELDALDTMIDYYHEGQLADPNDDTEDEEPWIECELALRFFNRLKGEILYSKEELRAAYPSSSRYRKELREKGIYSWPEDGEEGTPDPEQLRAQRG